MQTIKMALLYLLGLAFLLLLVAVVINQPMFDEELLPEIVAIKNIQANSFDEDNAYPAFIAMHAPSGVDLRTASETIRQHLNDKIQSTGLDYLSDDEHQTLLGSGHDGHWKNLYTSCNSRLKSTCMQVLFDEFKSKPVEDARLMEQIQRYQDLIQLSDYSDASQLTMYDPLPRYSMVLTLQRLYLAHVFSTENSAVFLQAVTQDMKFWHMVMHNSHLLLTKMVAVAAYHTGIGSLSAAIKQQHFSQSQLSQLQSQLKSSSPASAHFAQTFEFELKYGISVLEAIEAESATGVLSQWFDFFQLNATLNDTYQYTTAPLKELAAMNAKQYHQFMASDEADEYQSPSKWSPTALYNPSGKMMIAFIPAYANYMGRVHDLHGMVQLLKLQIDLALNPDQPIPQVIKNSPWLNPYTGQAMAYDDKAQRIYFACAAMSSSCELHL